ncbi:MAG: hypothetical protein P4L42_14060 [Desulfocapsaceae bacterium]|nr:hypothetical protein [Desulfocapsaceae bacterium]
MTDQQQFNEKTTPSASEASSMPLMSEGIGLSHEEVRRLLQGNHGKIENDDPILMLITVLNAFLAEEEKLLDRHNKALSRIISERTEGYIKAVQETTAALGKSLSSSSLEGITRIFEAHGLKMERLKTNMMWLAAIAATSSLVNVAVFAVLALLRK